MDKEKIDKTDATLAVDDLYDSHQDNSEEEEDDDKENGYNTYYEKKYDEKDGDSEDYYDDDLHELKNNYADKITDTLYTMCSLSDSPFYFEERILIGKDIDLHIQKMLNETNNNSKDENLIYNSGLLINNKLLLAYFIINDKQLSFGEKYGFNYENYIMCNSTFKCTLTDFLRLRYIKECGKESIESYITSCKKESKKESKKVKLLCIGNKVQDTATETFDSYSKRQKRHLSDVIGIFFPEGTKQLNAKNTSDEKTKSQIMLNCIECSFFSFILDTYDNMSCYNLSLLR